MNIFRPLFAALFCFICFPAHAELKVFLGTVGFARGAGAAGHAFAIVQDSNTPEFAADVFNYTLKNEDQSEISLSGALLHPGMAALYAERISLFDFYMGYGGALDRLLVFYELNLTQDEAQRFATALRADAADADFGKSHKYNAYLNNCMTRLLELVNASVDASKRVELIENFATIRDSQSGYRQALSNGVLNRLPYNVIRVLDNHPISKGRVRILERLSDTHFRFLMAISRRLENTAKICGWQNKTYQSLAGFLALAENDPVHHNVLPVLKKLTTACPASKAQISTVALLLSRTMLSDDLLERRQELIDLGVEWSAP